MKPFRTLNDFLRNITQAAFQKAGLDIAFAEVKMADRPDLADYQCNGSLILGKKLQRNPQELAQEIIGHLTQLTTDIEFSVAGPGFINYKIKPSYLLKSFQEFSVPEHLSPAKKHKVFIDYGGPNVAKPMHVGHLRSSIIGQSLKNLFRFMGHDVTGDIHLGDWGTQMGMLIIALEETDPKVVYFDTGFTGPYPKESPVTLEDLQRIYPQISARCAEDEMLATKARQATFELQQGRPGYRALWKHFVDVSVVDMKTQFEKLGVSFEQWFGESRYQDQIPSLLEDLKHKNILEKSQGAFVINVSEPTDKKEVPPVLLEKSDGGILYATTDLATIRERVETFKADDILYVVDGRQSLHFEQVFRAARKAGYTAQFEFLGFGTMNGPDNKPFKTRAGGAMRLEELIHTLVEEAKSRTKEAHLETASETITNDTAQKIGIAALKFADLQHNMSQNYQFDVAKFMNFEGKTGPYLLYAVVRIKSILLKAGTFSFKGAVELEPQEKELILWILRFQEIMEKAFEKRALNMLCDYAFELAQCFSRFYQACPILSDKNDPETKALRLLIAQQTQNTLEKVLSVLGIDCPDHM
ncbi:MAG: arginine--tRNA ligase [Alphaproteobacteria bacterium]